MELNKFAEEVHALAIEKGWWDEEKSFGDVIALIHTEASEAFEEYRRGNGYRTVDMIGKPYEPGGPLQPHGIPIEFADVILRILDFCGKHKIDIETAIKMKHFYNKTRPYKHGGKKI